jgi:Polyketide cyclase / dehydrase and lipid transport
MSWQEWEISESIVSAASPQKIWQLWMDVERWRDWDEAIEWSRLDGALSPGTKGELKPKQGPKSNFTIAEIEPERKLTDTTKLPGCNLEFIHEIEPCPSGTKITHRIKMTGLTTPLFAQILGKNFTRELPIAIRNLDRLATAGA